MSRAHIGKHHSPDTKKKLSEANRGKYYPPKIRNWGSGEKNPAWKGGKIIDREGYALILCPNHPHADRNGYVLEHRLVMEAHLGRTLLPTEVVHHINGIRDDNRYENLMLFPSTAEHTRFHRETG